jgi:hypothetical protein
MAGVNGDEFSALWAAIAELRGELQEVRGELHEVRGVLNEHTARLDEHFQFHLAHAEGISMLMETGREHSASLAEILRRLDAA